MQLFVIIGSFSMAIAVVLGAFGAHALKNKLTADMATIYQTGVQYHIAHALGLIAIGLLAQTSAGGALLNTAGWLLLAGTLLFSGSLYVLVLTGVKRLGAITPLGGLCFIAGWVMVAVSAF